MDVLGENEALQQFFNGQDVSGVLESVAVEQCILEQGILQQYLSCDVEHTSIMLPESPPDSGSEPCSPPQMPDVQYVSNNFVHQLNQDAFPHISRNSSSSCRFKDRPQAPFTSISNPPQQHQRGTMMTSMVPDQPVPDFSLHTHYLSPAGSTPHTPAVHETLQQTPCIGPGGAYPRTTAPSASPCLPQSSACPELGYQFLHHKPGPAVGSLLHETKKRRRSGSLESDTDPGVWTKAPYLHSEGGACDMAAYESDMPGGSPGQGGYQLLSWDQYQSGQWCSLYNSSYESLPPPAYHVDTDKGFNYSPADEAFVCQKKNHFQLTVHIGMAGEPKYVRTPQGPEAIDSFYLKVFGVKFEDQIHIVTIEQSQSDRSKKTFHPVKVDLPGNKITKVTLGRLHFSETTANNMRKKGKPNPHQRYFMMVVGLYASVKEGSHLLGAHVSERIIVRASNPGQFENDNEVLWQRGQAPDSMVCHGRVGINTDMPDEALVVCGNVKVMGSVMHPSDRRAKENIQEVNPTEQLRRIAQMRIVEYDYKPEFAMKMGMDRVHETGIIAQEVKELLPNAVKEVGDITCSNGEKIPNFLMVDKEQIFMENVGAVKQLCKLTDNLETRIQELEVWNTQLSKLKKMGSLRSYPGSSKAPNNKGKVNRTSSVAPPKKPTPKPSKEHLWEKCKHCLHHRAFRASVILLVTTMAFCVISITALYLLTLEDDLKFGDSTNSTAFPVPTINTHPPTVHSTAPPGPWPQEVDFCHFLECADVYCCPSSSADKYRASQSSSMPSTFSDEREQFLEKLRNSSDWTNTTIHSIYILQNLQVIDQRYCNGKCGPGNYSYSIPISRFVPLNMRITLLMNTTELLVVHLCKYDVSDECSAVMDYSKNEVDTHSNTQGYLHEWILPVARLHKSYFHFRATVAGQADCNTDPNFVKLLFTDYHFHFYRICD
ncbi:myelin regulatory factor-like protein [Denticeps clupeoides]|uniref:myelin regulatory factor-like protein n=1 Tax=Denticeps clupeoides TaxID=299321 RepID=UPI0010A308C8|nr:myelin regulatory factor-like protein [Denticeps clupeoides]